MSDNLAENLPSSEVQPALLRKMNERRILEVVQEHGPLSRADVRRLSGISAPTVSKTVAALIDAKFLEECDVPPTSPGRPSKILKLASKTVQVLGLTITPNHCRVISAGLDEAMNDEHLVELPTPGNYEEILDLYESACKKLMQDTVPTLGIGISLPGLLNRRSNTTLFAANLPQLNGKSLAADLQKRLDVETIMLNESYTLCLAERSCGAAKNLQDFGIVDMTAGLGFGAFVGGQYLDGHSGLGAELGHICVDVNGKLCGCGNRGCLETVATDKEIAAALTGEAQELKNIPAIVAQVKSGELNATSDQMTDCLQYVAIALAAAINLYNPSTLFVYSRFLNASDAMFQQVVELTRKRSLGPTFDDCTIQRAKADKLQGAISGVVNHLTTSRGPSLNG